MRTPGPDSGVVGLDQLLYLLMVAQISIVQRGVALVVFGRSGSTPRKQLLHERGISQDTSKMQRSGAIGETQVCAVRKGNLASLNDSSQERLVKGREHLRSLSTCRPLAALATALRIARTTSVTHRFEELRDLARLPALVVLADNETQARKPRGHRLAPHVVVIAVPQNSPRHDLPPALAHRAEKAWTLSASDQSGKMHAPSRGQRSTRSHTRSLQACNSLSM
mmetsp:Transcript_167305/g.531917  ORF Transcript_167305/g.531917 Transcript_167305/m.531917 type:complete len:223 (-) Transcript_167305:156-824(-)